MKIRKSVLKSLIKECLNEVDYNSEEAQIDSAEEYLKDLLKHVQKQARKQIKDVKFFQFGMAINDPYGKGGLEVGNDADSTKFHLTFFKNGKPVESITTTKNSAINLIVKELQGGFE